MTIYVCSDVHYDFYVPPALPKNYFKRRFLPADVLVAPGDVANTFDDYARFIKDVSIQYKDTVLCLGNHDIAVKFDKGRFTTSEEKISAIKELCSNYNNIHLLDGDCAEIADKYAKDGKIWCAGHVHTSSKEGNILVNPLGYPGEMALRFNGLSREDFLLEI